MSGARSAACNIGRIVVIPPQVVAATTKIQQRLDHTGVILKHVFWRPSMVPRVDQPAQPMHAQARAFGDAGSARCIGATATIVCGHIGAYALIAAGTGEERSDHALVTGNPGRVTGWMCECGAKLASGARAPEAAVCAACGTKYRVQAGSLAAVKEP